MATASRFSSLTQPGEWATICVALPVEGIQYLCVIFEGYDNLALVRTPWQGSGTIYIYTAEKNIEAVKQILTDIGATIPLTITQIAPGMKDLDALWQE